MKKIGDEHNIPGPLYHELRKYKSTHDIDRLNNFWACHYSTDTWNKIGKPKVEIPDNEISIALFMKANLIE